MCQWAEYSKIRMLALIALWIGLRGTLLRQDYNAIKSLLERPYGVGGRDSGTGGYYVRFHVIPIGVGEKVFEL